MATIAKIRNNLAAEKEEGSPNTHHRAKPIGNSSDFGEARSYS